MHHLKLGIKYLGTSYHLAWINPDPDKKELFIQFLSNSKTRKIEVPTYKDGQILFKTGFWEHFSIHSDGKVHVRTKSKGKKKEYVHNTNIGHSIYDYKQTEIVPILSNTYCIHVKPDFFTPMSEDETKSNSHLWQLNKHGCFTMLIFLAQHHNHESFYNDYIKKKLNIRSIPIIVDMGNKLHCLIILLTAKIPIEFKNRYLKKQFVKMNESSNSIPFVSFGLFPTIEYLENGLVNQ